MAAISRKYRPQNFSQMVGQNHIKLTLQNELESESFVQAYLFSGPRGLGKTTVARLMAKAVNCEQRKKGESEPCNSCGSCTDFNQARSLDVIEIDAASHTGVDNVRENIIENVRFSPQKSKFKVFIIDEVHMLSISAFNALLKTLEEPPAHVLFILCTTEIHRVPETIISRCQRFDFKKLSRVEIVKRLKRIADMEKVKIDDEVFDIIAGKSEGCMRDAESLLGQVLGLGGSRISREQVAIVLPNSEMGLIVEICGLLVGGKLSETLELINDLVDKGVDLEIFTKELIEFLRKLVLIKLGVVKGEWLDLSAEVQKEADRIVSYTDAARLAEMIRILLGASIELKNTTIIQLPLELAAIRICDKDTGSGKLSGPRVPLGPKDTESQGPQELKKKENDLAPAKRVDSKIDLAKIKGSWVKIIQASQKKNRDLMFINQRMVWPVGVEVNSLIVGFQYELHKERFEANGNQEKFVKAIKEVVGEAVSIQAKTLKPSELAEIDMAREEEMAASENMSGVKVSEDSILDAVLDSFGGEVVEE